MYHFKGIVKGYGYGILRHAQVWGGLDLPYFACVVLVVRRLQTPNQTRSSILHFGLVSHLFCFKHNQFLKFANNVISSFHTTFREEPISWSRAGESFPSKKKQWCVDNSQPTSSLHAFEKLEDVASKKIQISTTVLCPSLRYVNVERCDSSWMQAAHTAPVVLSSCEGTCKIKNQIRYDNVLDRRWPELLNMFEQTFSSIILSKDIWTFSGLAQQPKDF